MSAERVGLTSAQAHVLMRLEAPTRMGDLAEAKTREQSEEHRSALAALFAAGTFAR